MKKLLPFAALFLILTGPVRADDEINAMMANLDAEQKKAVGDAIKMLSAQTGGALDEKKMAELMDPANLEKMQAEVSAQLEKMQQSADQKNDSPSASSTSPNTAAAPDTSSWQALLKQLMAYFR